jgi:hypothetical protein
VPGTRKIQVSYLNTYQSLWEYKESFLAGQIDFDSRMGPACPLCGRLHCYRKIAPYWRYAVELFPEFCKERIPVARFLCRQRRRTFSLLPVQLIPYFQYTVGAVFGTLLLGWGHWQRGQGGFWGASVEVDSESLVTPWLVAFWLAAVLRGLRRGHAVLGRFCDLTGIGTFRKTVPWEEAAGYFMALGLKPKICGFSLLMDLVARYSRTTKQFLFGIPSQQRASVRP